MMMTVMYDIDVDVYEALNVCPKVTQQLFVIQLFNRVQNLQQ